MPSSASSFTSSEIDIRYKEELLTDSLNTKYADILPAGVHSGFDLVTSGLDMHVTLNGGVAAYKSGTGKLLAIRRSASTNLDLTVYASKTVAIAIYAQYTTSAVTSADVRVYEVSPSDELTGAPEEDELIVLGQVTVPASGAIAASSISKLGRDLAGASVLSAALPQYPLLRNANFAFADLGAKYDRSAYPWYAEVSGGEFEVRDVVANPVPGSDRYLAYNHVFSTGIGELYQHNTVPVSLAEGQAIYVHLEYEMVKAATGGTMQVFVDWMNQDGNPSASTSTQNLSIGSTGTRSIKIAFEPPSASMVRVARVGVKLNSVDFGLVGEAIRFYLLQAFTDQRDEYFGVNAFSKDDQILKSEQVSSLVVWDPDIANYVSASATPLGVAISFDQNGGPSSLPLLKVGRLDDRDNTAPGGTAFPGPLLQLFSAIKGLQESLVRSGNPLVPGVQSIHDDAALTLFWENHPESGEGVNEPSIRLYTTGDGTLHLTTNAKWDGVDTWNKDILGDTAHAIKISRSTGIHLRSQLATADFWLEGGWIDNSISGGIDLGSDPYFNKVSMHLDLDDDTHNAIPRNLVEFSADVSQRALLSHFKDISGILAPANLRIYSGSTESQTTITHQDADAGSASFELVYNASYNHSTGQWEQDNGLLYSYMISISGLSEVRLYRKGTLSSPWAADDWSSMELAFTTGTSGGLALPNRYIFFDSETFNNSNYGVPLRRNLFGHKQVVKAWARLEIPASGGGIVNVLQGYNVASASGNGTFGVTVNFHQRIADTTPGGDEIAVFTTSDVSSVTDDIMAVQGDGGATSLSLLVMDQGRFSVDVDTLSSDYVFFVMVLSYDTGQ